MTPDILTLALATVALLGAACWAWGDALAREAMDAQLEADKEASRTAVFNDRDGRCHVCHEPARELELVELYDAFTLTCVACTHQIKVRRGRQGVA